MNTPSLHPINAETLWQLAPSIHVAWRTDNWKVFLALGMKESVKQGVSPDAIIATSYAFVLEWLNSYLEKNHTVTASMADSKELVVRLLQESLTLAVGLS